MLSSKAWSGGKYEVSWLLFGMIVRRRPVLSAVLKSYLLRRYGFRKFAKAKFGFRWKIFRFCDSKTECWRRPKNCLVLRGYHLRSNGNYSLLNGNQKDLWVSWFFGIVDEVNLMIEERRKELRERKLTERKEWMAIIS